MHLSHMLPSLLFLQHIKTPQLDAVGVTMPGLPFLVGGHNGSIAWGATSAVADVVDLLVEREDPQRDGFVLNETRDCRLEENQVAIRVRDGDDFEERSFPLRRTCNGPLLNDMYPNYLPDGSPLVSIRWELPDVQRSIGNLHRANRSATHGRAARQLDEDPQPGPKHHGRRHRRPHRLLQHRIGARPESPSRYLCRSGLAGEIRVGGVDRRGGDAATPRPRERLHREHQQQGGEPVPPQAPLPRRQRTFLSIRPRRRKDRGDRQARPGVRSGTSSSTARH